jgi:hypothetical protein
MSKVGTAMVFLADYLTLLESGFHSSNVVKCEDSGASLLSWTPHQVTPPYCQETIQWARNATSCLISMFLTKFGKKVSLFICDQLMDFVDMITKVPKHSDLLLISQNLDLLWWKKMFRISLTHNRHIRPDLSCMGQYINI